jgi:hypothetical protein
MKDENVSLRFLWRCFLSLVVVGAAAPSVASTAGFFSVGVLDAGFFDDLAKNEVVSNFQCTVCEARRNCFTPVVFQS